MNKIAAEWLKQADHAMTAAEGIFAAGFRLEAVFECHLAVEKALKALYAERTSKVPPKTHDLGNLATLLGLSVPPQIGVTLADLALVNIESRYPIDLDAVLNTYHQAKTEDIVKGSREAIKWIKAEF